MQAGTIAAPKRLEDLNLRRDLVASLVLRTLAFADQLSGAALEARLGLPFETIEPIIQEFQKAQLMDTMGFASEPGLDGRPIPVRMAYTVSSAGRQRAAEMSAVQTRYLGPCPVRFEDYVELVRSQVSSRAGITDGALKTDQLELTYDGQNRYYEAPLQWKANTGVLVIDDFGRQEAPANRILNRFIVPMEKKVDYLDLSASGRKIELPFLCQVVFSTNLSPTELVDEAFLRRMAYKIGVGNPSPEAFGRILRYECDRQGVSFDEKAIGYLLNNLYGKKPLRGSPPRALIARLVDLANYRQESPRLTPQTLKEAFDACFNPALGSVTEDDWARPQVT